LLVIPGKEGMNLIIIQINKLPQEQIRIRFVAQNNGCSVAGHDVPPNKLIIYI
jgi:hypothetical protein